MFGLLSYLNALNVRRIINSSSHASDPTGLRLSHDRLRLLCPSLYPSSGLVGFIRCVILDGFGKREFIRDMLANGDSRAAVVLQTNPLLVASYCDDSDAVCMLEFNTNEVGCGVYRVGDRLFTVLNSLVIDRRDLPGEVASDLVQGEKANPRYVNFWPLIAEFVSDDTQQIERRKAAISPSEYARCQSLGEEHLRRFPGRVRDGRPDRSQRPAV